MDTSLLMSLLAAKGGGRSPGTQDFLARAAAGGPALDPQEVLSRLGQNNPAVAQLMQLMNAQKTAVNSAPPVPVAGTVIDEAAAEMEELRNWLETSNNEVSVLREQLYGALGEIKALRERSDHLAGALGACCLCWGQDSGCRACRGHGHPGRSVPDERLFSEYVLPAVQLLRASRRSTVVTALPPVTGRAPGADTIFMRHTS